MSILDSLLEKFTLYDLLSYFIPGFVCLCLTAAGFAPELGQYYDSDALDGLKGYMAFAFLIFSYVVGIAISSVAWLLCEMLFSLQRFYKFFHGKRKTGEAETNDQLLNRALLCSGLLQEEIDEGMQKRMSVSLEEVFAEYIYADIQADVNYKRIHNYASSETLYKNLACAFLLAAVAVFLFEHLVGWQVLENIVYLRGFELVISMVFVFRWKRFRKKKIGYAIQWFVGKYIKKTKDENKYENKRRRV